MIRLGDQTQWQKENLEHTRYEYDLDQDSIIIDIGAYEGEFTKKIQDKYRCFVVAFEPTNAIEKLYNVSYASVVSGKLLIVKEAAWLHDGEIEMGGENFWVGMYEHDNKQKFPCIDIAEYAADNMDGIPHQIDLMKINIEGGEYQVLRHLINNRVQFHIKYFQIQFHLVDGQDSEKEYQEIADMLSGTHELQWRYPFVWESWKSKTL